MIYKKLHTFFVIFFLGVVSIHAKEVTVSLQSTDRDKVTIKYDVVSRDGSLFIRFTDVKKQIESGRNRKYRDSDKIKVLFFDKNGGYVKNKFSSDIGTDAIMVNSDEIEYTWSDDGYVWLEEKPELQLRLLASKATLSIPSYLAYYDRLHTYQVFANCGLLEISLTRSQITTADETAINSRVGTNIVSDDKEQESEENEKMAAALVDKIRGLLNQSSRSMPEGIDAYTSQLRQLELTITDRYLKSRISEVLQNVENKKAEIERIRAELQMRDAADAAQKAKETEAATSLNYLKDKLDNIDKRKVTESDANELHAKGEELRQKSYEIDGHNPELASQMRKTADRCEDEVDKYKAGKKRRNIWRIIGGFFLAVLLFAGNQTFQHFRNIRSQRGMEEMQAKIVRRAENEAKRRARSVIHGKVKSVENAARRKSQDAVRNSINNGVKTVTKGKGNKRFSI